MSSAEATASELSVGRSVFVETVLEHPTAPQWPRIESDGVAPYYIDNKNKRLTLAGAPLEPFEKGDVIRARGYYSPPAVIFGDRERSTLTVEADYRQVSGTEVAVEDKQQSSQVSVRVKDDTIFLSTKTQSVEVGPDTEQILELKQREVTVRGRSTETKLVPNPRDVGPETVEKLLPGPLKQHKVNPVLKIRNHGELEVFGEESALILPLQSDDKYAQTAIESLRATDASLNVNRDSDLLVARFGGGN